MKLFTEVKIDPMRVGISLNDRIMVLGSCFADSMGEKMLASGFNVCVNPFGTLYNPASILSSLERLDSGEAFTPEDCVEMGAGANLVCSFKHHTSFARKTGEEFLSNANGALASASEFFRACNKIIITLGTSFIWTHTNSDEIVSNCLKRPASEFTHTMLGIEDIERMLLKMKSFGKEIIFTVSPIRHMSDGAHANALSKAHLLAAVEAVADGRTEYFPAFEIMMDELRDYRFYAEDLVHPSPAAVGYIWERFVDAAVPSGERQALLDNARAARRGHHIEMH